MRLALLPAFVLALVAVGWRGHDTHASFASTLAASTNHPALYSVAAQGTTTATVSTGTTPTAAATSASTPTEAVTATTTVQNTPVPLPTAASGGSLQLNPLNWNYLTSAAPDGSGPSGILGAFGPFSWIYLALMLALLGGAGYIYFVKRQEWRRTNTVYRRAAERFAPPAMWIAGITILFMLFRVIHLDGLNLRIWLYLCFVALIGLAVWFYYWYSRSMPGELAKFQKTQRARQYMPAAKKGSSRPAAAPKTNPNNPVRTVESTTIAPSSAAGTPGTTRPASRPGSSSAKRKKRR
jgi:hypothetical protein